MAIKGTKMPSTTWDVSTDGKLEFEGVSNYQTLYTNYLFNGSTQYRVQVNNYSEHDLSVKLKTRLKTYYSTTISADSSTTDLWCGSGYSTTTNVYLRFAGDYMNFSGYIY